MFKKCLFFSIFIFLKTVGSNPSFDSIIRENADNPAKILEFLKEIRQNSSEADAFLRKFGGEDYGEEPNSVKKLSSDVESKVKEAAFIVGNEMRKKGAMSGDDIESLKISQKFLDYADPKIGTHFCDQDVSSSFLRDQLNGMIATRTVFQEKVDELKKNWNGDEDSSSSESELLSDSLLNEM